MTEDIPEIFLINRVDQVNKINFISPWIVQLESLNHPGIGIEHVSFLIYNRKIHSLLLVIVLQEVLKLRPVCPHAVEKLKA
jgi:hypothetical protein